MDIELKYLKTRAAARRDSISSQSGSSGQVPVRTSADQPSSHLGTTNEKSSLDSPSVPSGSTGGDPETLSLKSSVDNISLAGPTARTDTRLYDMDPTTAGITNHTDIFITSGTKLCYGILLVVFDLIESPVFNRILYIIGFKGDRERGTR